MKETPIIFNTDMVRAILGGRKTQTRRVIDWKAVHKKAGLSYPAKCRLAWFDIINSWGVDAGDGVMREVDCPYGVPGDILWVRETWCRHAVCGKCETEAIYKKSNCGNPICASVFHWKAGAKSWTYEGTKWNPSIHMPRAAARIFLRVKSVRVERVQDITEADAKSEGCLPRLVWEKQVAAKDKFFVLWNSIYAKRGAGLDANPWVWVVEFECVENYTGIP